MPRHMAADIDGARQTGDMRWVRFDIDGKASRFAAEALRSYIQRIDRVAHRFFQFRIQRIYVTLRRIADQRFFGKIGGVFEIAPQSDADHNRRTGIAAGILYGIGYKPDDILFFLPTG